MIGSKQIYGRGRWLLLPVIWPILGAGPVVGGAPDAEESGIFTGPLALEAVHPVALDEPLEIKTRGQPGSYREMWLLVSTATVIPPPVTDNVPPSPRIDVPPLMPILHVNEHRAELVSHDRERGVFGWLVPKVDLEQAFFWYPIMTEDSAAFWEGPFWEKGLSLEQIVGAATQVLPQGADAARGKVPTYTAAEVTAALGHDRPVVTSLDAVRDVVKQAAQSPGRK